MIMQKFNIVILGGEGVGKTALAHRLSDWEFKPEYKKTIGFDFFAKPKFSSDSDLVISDVSSNGMVELSRIIEKKQLVILAYDVTRKDSLQELESWIEEVQSVPEDGRPSMILVGCKKDLVGTDEVGRQVSLEDAEKFAKQHDIAFIGETSSKDRTTENLLTNYLKHHISIKRMIEQTKDVLPSIVREEINKYLDSLENPQTEQAAKDLTETMGALEKNQVDVIWNKIGKEISDQIFRKIEIPKDQGQILIDQVIEPTVKQMKLIELLGSQEPDSGSRPLHL